MYLRNIIYQMKGLLKSLIGEFHKSHTENLAAMIVGIVYSRNVTLPKIAERAPVKPIQLESRVQRFERLLACEKFVPQQVLEPITRRILKKFSKRQQLLIVMDRSLIEDKLNLLHLAVVFCGRALPLGWIKVAGKGTSQLAEQQELLSWLKRCLPAQAKVIIIADREFHSIHLANWIEQDLGWHFILRIQSKTQVAV